MNLKEKIISEIKKIYDPEIPVNIYELGLIYDILIKDKEVKIKMTLTTPNCPVAESLPKEVKDSIAQIKEVQTLRDEGKKAHDEGNHEMSEIILNKALAILKG